ncbi:MAG: hypothetical protein IPJ65_05100 [Archangiaceae bacterium]|nr:hypothetical protein [Archangiaceae bacterium]
MRKLLLLCVVSLWSSQSFAKEPPKAAPAVDAAGTFAAKGANPGGKGGYEGTVTITKNGETYNVAWALPGSPEYKGVAIMMDGTLGVGWGMGAAYGVVVYRVSGGSLKGLWATSGSGPKPGIEELEGPAGLNGGYKIVKGAGPDGKPYSGNVSITPNGDVFNVTWTLPRETYSGVAIKQGDLLIVGWGAAGKGAGVVSYQQAGKNFDGKWGAPGSGQLGTETLTRK